MAKIRSSSRQKIYLILVFVSLILLFCSVQLVYPVITEEEDPLGLASGLPPCYWIGLALLVVTSVFAFLDRELKKDAIFIIILIALGLFLFGLTVFFKENPWEPSVYYPFAEVRNLLETHHIDIAHPPGGMGVVYYSWPAFHFINASILDISGVAFDFVIKYMPLFFLLCFVFIVYSIGKRFKLAPNLCFLITFLAISSWFFAYAGTYYPRTLAMILFLLLFMLLLIPRRTVAETVVAVLIFSALVLSHGLAAAAVIPGLLLLSLYRRDTRFVALFLVIFAAWYIYEAASALEPGMMAFIKPWHNILGAVRVERILGPTPMHGLALRYSQLGYLAVYVALMMGSATLLLRRKIIGERRKQVISLFCWSIAISLLIFWGLSGELLFRTYDFLVVPALCIAVLSLSSRKIMTPIAIALMCLFVALHPTANYGNEVVWGQVLTTERSGTEFFALRVKPSGSYFCNYDWGLVLYNDPNLLRTSGASPVSYLMQVPASVREEKGWGEGIAIMDSFRYVIISNQGGEGPEFPWRAWPQTESGKRADLIYSNGDFQIYHNRFYKP